MATRKSAPVKSTRLAALKKLGWKNYLKIFAVSLIVIFIAIVFFFNIHIFKSLSTKVETKSSSNELIVSDTVRGAIDRVVIKSDIIVAIQVVTVDFQKNTRLETFTSIDNPILKEIYETYLRNKVVETPLFNDDKINNRRLIRLMNGDFVCIPFKDSFAYRHKPSASAYITDVCAVGIPPYYGEFTGILTIYLKRPPDSKETENIFALSRNLSNSIFDENRKQYENKK